jgi:hypothetical protein
MVIVCGDLSEVGHKASYSSVNNRWGMMFISRDKNQRDIWDYDLMGVGAYVHLVTHKTKHNQVWLDKISRVEHNKERWKTLLCSY